MPYTEETWIFLPSDTKSPSIVSLEIRRRKRPGLSPCVHSSLLVLLYPNLSRFIKARNGRSSPTKQLELPESRDALWSTLFEVGGGNLRDGEAKRLRGLKIDK